MNKRIKIKKIYEPERYALKPPVFSCIAIPCTVRTTSLQQPFQSCSNSYNPPTPPPQIITSILSKTPIRSPYIAISILEEERKRRKETEIVVVRKTPSSMRMNVAFFIAFGVVAAMTEYCIFKLG